MLTDYSFVTHVAHKKLCGGTLVWYSCSNVLSHGTIGDHFSVHFVTQSILFQD